jgi:methionyl-tRNA synthetase
MTAPHTYITTTVPYVNARPHIGHALEYVQADVLARSAAGGARRSGSRPAPTTAR